MRRPGARSRNHRGSPTIVLFRTLPSPDRWTNPSPDALIRRIIHPCVTDGHGVNVERSTGLGNVVGDTTIGVIPRDRLADVLALIHRGGYGPMARVFDPIRGALAGQLDRAGLPDLPESVTSGDVVVLGVTAPGHAARVGAALLGGGALAVYVTNKGRAGALLAPVGASADGVLSQGL